MRRIDGLILAGGKSSRMGGSHKGDLMYQEQTFLERILEEFQKEAHKIWISYGDRIRNTYPGCRIVRDEYPNCGPIGGLHAGLKACSEEWVMVSACDMPYLKIELYRYLQAQLDEEAGIWENERRDGAEWIPYDGIIPVSEGRIHPLAAIYRKSMADILERQLEQGNYRLRDALEQGNIRYVDLTKQPRLRRMLKNVNTVSEYRQLLQEESKQEHHGNKQKIIAVSGIKNSGKTTLLVRLIEELTRRGMKVAAIKHDGHDFACDISGTDSFRFQEAGAYGTAVYSNCRMFIHKLCEPSREELIAQFPEAELVLMEGMKDSRYPKIEVVRRTISDTPASNPEGRFLIVTDWEPERFAEPAVSFEDLDEIISRMLAVPIAPSLRTNR